MKAPTAAAARSEESSPSPVPSMDVDVLQAPYTPLLIALDNKKKYLEARVEKLERWEEEAKKGTELPQDKEKARLCLPDVKNQIGFLSVFHKKMLENERDYKRKNKLRQKSHNDEKENLRKTTAVDALTIRYVLTCYMAPERQRRLADAFTAEEQVRLDMLCRYFVPEIARGGCILSCFQKHKTEIDAILQRNENYHFEDGNGFTGADAFHLLDALKRLVEDPTYNTEDRPSSGPEPVRHVEVTYMPSPIDSTPTPDGPIQPTTTPASSPECASPAGELVADVPQEKNLSFGYFSDESVKRERPKEEVAAAVENVIGAAAPAEPVPVDPTNAAPKDDVKKPRGPPNKRRFNNKKPFVRKPKASSESASDTADKENKKELAERRPRTERPPRPERSERPHKAEVGKGDVKPAQARANGAPRGGNHNNGQRRFNGPRENREYGVNNENGTGYRGAPRQANGNDRAPQNAPAGQKSGFKPQAHRGGHSNNGYNKEEENKKSEMFNSTPRGYVRQGGYIRPPVGTSGFILQD